MSLLDFDNDLALTVLRQSHQRAANSLGMPKSDLVVANGPSSDENSPNIQRINGRISRLSSHQQVMWMTLGFEVTGTLYADTGSLYGDLVNGDVVVDDAGIKYRIVGRARSIAKGNLPSYFAYPLKSEQST